MLNRVTRERARDQPDLGCTLREQLEYGDGGTPQQPAHERITHRIANRLGRIWRHYDEAGRLEIRYDLKGNPLEITRRVVSDEWINRTFSSAAQNGWHLNRCIVDWEAGTPLPDREAEMLGGGEYTTTNVYDALNRIRRLLYPVDAASHRNTLRAEYNHGGGLERVASTMLYSSKHIAYDAKGQRSLIVYGNHVMTRYAYDSRHVSFEAASNRAMRTRREYRAHIPPHVSGGAAAESWLHLRPRRQHHVHYRPKPGSGTLGDPAVADPDLDASLRQSLGAGDAIVFGDSVRRAVSSDVRNGT